MTTARSRCFLQGFLLLSLYSSISKASVSDPLTIHDLLRSQGLPAGLLPKAVQSYTFDRPTGRLEVFLGQPCLTKFETRLHFDTVVRANLSYAALTDVDGLEQEELFLWLPVKDIIVEPGSGVILFDIVVAHKQLSLSLFDNPPDCKAELDALLLDQTSGLSWNNGRQEKGFLSEREKLAYGSVL